jgi:hypothetical protein
MASSSGSRAGLFCCRVQSVADVLRWRERQLLLRGDGDWLAGPRIAALSLGTVDHFETPKSIECHFFAAQGSGGDGTQDAVNNLPGVIRVDSGVCGYAFGQLGCIHSNDPSSSPQDSMGDEPDLLFNI